jgi:hypothetical protein
MKQIVFDNETETFRIDDLWPQGASPQGPPVYTPWDENEDGYVDQISPEGYPIFSAVWPFSYWDDSAHQHAMMFHYNLQLMTEPNEQGWMACVWEDSHRARLYNEYPDVYPQYAEFWDTPEILISVSPDNGWTWLEPIVLNSVETPALADMIPMWVYPRLQEDCI